MNFLQILAFSFHENQNEYKNLCCFTLTENMPERYADLNPELNFISVNF